MNKEFNVDDVRLQFPILAEKVYNKNLIYLDNGATTQKPLAVIDVYDNVYRKVNANIHRGVHHLSNVCTDLYEKARQIVARHLNAADSSEIVFTRNTTESINLVAYAYGDKFVGPGDEIVVSEMEHHSNIVPWQLLCQRRGAKLLVAKVSDHGELDMGHLAGLLSERTRIVSIAHVSNVMGSVNDVRTIVGMAHSVGAVAVIDAAQSVPHQAIDVQSIGCDFLAFSGHKVYAPLGSGALYGRRDLLNAMNPWMAGGEMIDKVSFAGTTFAEPPLKFEAGTPDYAAAIALGAALDYVDGIGMDVIEAHEASLVKRTLDGLLAIPGVRVIGQAENHASAVSFLVDSIHPYDAGMILDKLGIAVRTGHHCAQPLMDRFGIVGTVRASFALYNTADEVDAMLNGVEWVKKMFS
ncbi:MAG: cysteine desulfurase [Bacteroidales bacterium]|nr:cysteine desulfurase [Bacteroidales bacterium]